MCRGVLEGEFGGELAVHCPRKMNSVNVLAESRLVLCNHHTDQSPAFGTRSSISSAFQKRNEVSALSKDCGAAMRFVTNLEA